MKRKSRVGFTIMEAVIAVLIVSGVSLAAISTVLAVRGMNEYYYKTICAYNELENLGSCIESAELTEPAGFFPALGFVYGVKDFSEAEDVNPGYYHCSAPAGGEHPGETYRIYYDVEFRPLLFRVVGDEPVFEGAEATYYTEIKIDPRDTRRLLLCTRTGETTYAKEKVPDTLLESEKTTETEETMVVDETVHYDDSGTEQISYEIVSRSERKVTADTAYADRLKQVLIERSVSADTKEIELPSGDKAMDQEQVRKALSGCFGLNGSLRGTVLDSAAMVSYSLCMYHVGNDKPVTETTAHISRTIPTAETGEGIDYVSLLRRSEEGRALGFSGGDGSEAFPYLIGSAEELAAMQSLSMKMRPTEQSIADDAEYLLLDSNTGSVRYYGKEFEVVRGEDEGSYVLRRDGSNGSEEQLVELTYHPENESLSAALEEGYAKAGLRLVYVTGGNKVALSVGSKADEPEACCSFCTDSVTEAEATMLRRNYYYFKLTDNIDLRELQQRGDTLCDDFCGRFDGDGFRITGGGGISYLFGTVNADSVIADLDLSEEDGAFIGIARTAGCTDRTAVRCTVVPEPVEEDTAAKDDTAGDRETGSKPEERVCRDRVLFENVRVYGTIRPADGESPFIRNACGGCVTFRRCDNYSDVLAGSDRPFAVYVSGTWQIGTDLVFENCYNYGTLLGEHVGLFVACEDRNRADDTGLVGELTAVNCASFGRILGKASAGYVCGCEDDFSFNYLWGSYTPVRIAVTENLGESLDSTADAAEEPAAAAPANILSCAPRVITLGEKWQDPGFVRGTLEPLNPEAASLKETAVTLRFSVPPNAPRLSPQPKSILLQFSGSYVDSFGKEQPLLAETVLFLGDTAFTMSLDNEGLPVYTASFRKAVFVCKETHESAGDNDTILRDRSSGIPYRIAESEGEGLTYFVFDLPSGAQMSRQAVCTAIIMGTDEIGMGTDEIGMGTDEIGQKDRIIGYADDTETETE